MTEPSPIKPLRNPNGLSPGRASGFRFFLLSVLTGILLLGGGAARAQETYVDATGVQISPVRFDWDLSSGDERTGIVNLKNYSDQPYQIEVSVEDFYVSDDSTQAQFFVPSQAHPLFAYDVINWLSLPENIELQPGEGRDVTFKVKVPEATPTGGYYGALFFKNKARGPEEEDQSSKIIINQRVGALLVLAVKGTEPIRREATLDRFAPEKKIFWENPARLLARIRNGGNLHFKGSGAIDIYRLGSKVASLQLEPRLSYPGRIRDYEADYKFPLWGYGYYRAELNYSSEDQGVRIAGTTTFWVFPWKTTVALLLFLGLLWLVYWLFTSKFEIRRKDEPEPPPANPGSDNPIPRV